MSTKNIKNYSELVRLPTFKERYEYLRIEDDLRHGVGRETFGDYRQLNQALYKSKRWQEVRDFVIIRDGACDLGVSEYEIHGRILIHHISPITADDLLWDRVKVFDPENLISTTHNTHLAIHYGDTNLLILPPIERRVHDTCPWKVY